MVSRRSAKPKSNVNYVPACLRLCTTSDAQSASEEYNYFEHFYQARTTKATSDQP